MHMHVASANKLLRPVLNSKLILLETSYIVKRKENSRLILIWPQIWSTVRAWGTKNCVVKKEMVSRFHADPQLFGFPEGFKLTHNFFGHHECVVMTHNLFGCSEGLMLMTQYLSSF
eukprot:TRINITY_DN6736_c0_g1_i1.p1 TRINITY_DN6736_c0_g1~~TRINITY_DN6736_c0_g1_i1.p1  ORF type:complete len:116 (-),score=3.25 TRINITY_DN6736_c0_g1_i1:147-494(-)